MNVVRSEPCSACPYRQDVPSGVWAEHEYEKLRQYDEPTGNQPFAPFACHATPEHLCNGWAVVHSNRGHEFDLLALRLIDGIVAIPTPSTPLFASGNEAADHGQREIAHPSEGATKTVDRLLRKFPRLEVGSE